MNVAEFIGFLKTQEQSLEVAITMCSEQCLLEVEDIRVYEACKPRPDGWVQHPRPDKELKRYLLLPGN